MKTRRLHHRNLPRAAFLVASFHFALLTPSAKAQSVATPPTASANVTAFEVASIKKNKSESNMVRIMGKADGFACENLPLKMLIAKAYGIKPDLISGGAGWVDTEGFDIDAKVAGPDVEAYKNLTEKERQSMLAMLLAERFNLKIHHETKILPVYNLVVAKGGLKIKELPPINAAEEAAKAPEKRRETNSFNASPGGFLAQGATFGDFAQDVSFMVHRTVTDKTGVSGIYDINLKWTLQDGPGSADADAETGPSLFTALQEQVGLKLEPAKGPVETIVIDHAEIPSEN